MRIGMGYDVHAFEEGRPLVLGGVFIPYHKGLKGHSDADALLHAIMDAMLGALALGDIGRHFPDTDEKYKGISSRLLLREVTKIVRDKGYRLVNLDTYILCQAPKIAPYREEIRKTIAEDLGVDISAVSVKAGTEEHMGFTGREEGLKATAICLLEEV